MLCEKKKGNKNLNVEKAQNRSMMLLSKCAVCNSKIIKFTKERGASGILTAIAIKTPFSKIPVLCDIFF